MVEIDASNGWGQLLRIAVSGALITQKEITIKNICKTYSPSGLNQSKLTQLQNLEQLGVLEIKGLGIGSTTITLTPTGKDLPKNIDIDLQRPSSTILALNMILFPVLFSSKKTTISIKGTTHGKKAPPATVYRDIYWRYLTRYLEEGEFIITKMGIYPEIGELNLILQGKAKLSKNTPKLLIRKPKELVAIKGNFAAKTQEYIQRSEKILSILFKSKNIPFSLITRITEKDVTAIDLEAFFGDSEGYDNFRPFIKGKDELFEEEINEKILVEFSREFQQEITNYTLDEHTGDFLVPLLALVGGEMPISQLSPHMKAAIPVLETLYCVKFSYINKLLSCGGYAGQIEPEEGELPSVDDL